MFTPSFPARGSVFHDGKTDFASVVDVHVGGAFRIHVSQLRGDNALPHRDEQRLCLVRRHAVRDVQDALGRLAIEARGSGFGLAIQQEPQLSGVQAF